MFARNAAMSISARFLVALGFVLGALSSPAQAADESTCRSFLASNPMPPGIPALSGPGGSQRSAFLADGGKLVPIGSRYYAVWVPPGFYTAAKRIVVFNLHGTGGYAEAEWNDWHSQFTSRGYAFVGLSWGGGTPSVESDASVYAQLQQIASELAAHCPFAEADRWLMGFSVGSAVSFAVMVRDVAEQRLFRGQIAISGAAISPLTSGTLMHATVEAAKGNPEAVRGLRSWMYCGELDRDHTWSMCNEMPQGEAFVNSHAGSAYLYRDATGSHHSLPGNAGACADLYAYLEGSPRAPAPQSGWWWNPQESGRGFTLEVKDQTMVLASYLYDADGHASWYLSAGRFFADGSFSASLDAYAGGQALSTSYRAATLQGSAGKLELSCRSEDACTLQWPGGTVPIERLVWDLGASPNTAPETGWWWNAEESGRGFFLEQQGATLVASAFMYETDGRAVWYLATAQASDGRYSGDWQQFGQGQTLTGPYRAPVLVNDQVGRLSLELADPATAILRLPDDRELRLTRMFP